ncbi:MAG TPA: hypothetical protein VK077_08835 [Virgibacillus sp.]|nr:hypothetical protein [Virgibacillus sp.]
MQKPNRPPVKHARDHFGGELDNTSLFGVGAQKVSREYYWRPGQPIGCIGSVGSGSSQAKHFHK